MSLYINKRKSTTYTTAEDFQAKKHILKKQQKLPISKWLSLFIYYFLAVTALDTIDR